MKKSKFFLLIGLKQIKFTALNEKKNILVEKNVLVNDLSLYENFKSIEGFLNQNIFNLEKRLNNHIKEIDLLINYDEFLTVDISTINNFNKNTNQPDNFSNFLVNIKDNIIKNIDDYNLTHMTIEKFIVDGKECFSIPNDNDYNNVFLQIRLLCLKNNILQSLKNIFSKYEILIKNISCYNYVYNFKNLEADNIFVIADKLRNGLNQKEIFFVDKPSKNNGFFEKFFNLFN